MTEGELAEILRQGHETPGVEFKGPAPRSDLPLFAKVTRAALAMANRRSGGRILVGVRENAGALVPDGLSDSDLATWTHDAVTGALSAYSDPYVSLSTQTLVHHGKRFVVLIVDEFEEAPVLCKKDYQGVLRAGACYVRRKGRIESSEVPNHAEMRDLLELATEKALRRFVRTASRAGLQIGGATSPDDADRYRRELEDFE